MLQLILYIIGNQKDSICAKYKLELESVQVN